VRTVASPGPVRGPARDPAAARPRLGDGRHRLRGMGTEGASPYLIGACEAYSALDSVRAAHHLPALSLSNQTVVWGHSQGGHAALWTGILAPSYAPDVTVEGVAALAPATDVVALAEQVQGKPGGSLGSAYVISAYSEIYEDVSFDDYVRAGARVQVAAAAKRCLSDPALLFSLITTLPSTQSPLLRRSHNRIPRRAPPAEHPHRHLGPAAGRPGHRRRNDPHRDHQEVGGRTMRSREGARVPPLSQPDPHESARLRGARGRPGELDRGPVRRRACPEHLLRTAAPRRRYRRLFPSRVRRALRELRPDRLGAAVVRQP
jgi:hypothetical protein